MNDQQIKKGFSSAFVLLCGMVLRHSSSRQPNNIYETEMDGIQQRMDELWDAMNQILTELEGSKE